MHIYMYIDAGANARVYGLCTYAFTLRPDLSFIYFAVRGAAQNGDGSVVQRERASAR